MLFSVIIKLQTSRRFVCRSIVPTDLQQQPDHVVRVAALPPAQGRLVGGGEAVQVAAGAAAAEQVDHRGLPLLLRLGSLAPPGKVMLNHILKNVKFTLLSPSV